MDKFDRRGREVVQLTQQEQKILHLIADGLSNKEIAQQLVITVSTAKWYIKQIFSKLDVSSRTQAIGVARANGLLGNNPGSPPISILKHNLPSQSTTFVGRAEELAEVAKLLSDPTCRLLTLTGPGGIGKTRLALQAATERLDDFPDGVWFISLVSIPSPNFLASTVLRVLNPSSHPQDEPKTELSDYLRYKSAFLVMDNFEHLLDGADLLSEILMVAPNVKILATSRERLALGEECLFLVSGMNFPDDDEPDDIEHYEAVTLFLQQAQRVHPGFSLIEDADRKAVIQICRLAEGMPLGIELAASWLRALPSQQIAEQLAENWDFLTTSTRNVPERHRSIRYLFEHSWNLLLPTEQGVFMRLSVFRGGFPLEGAEYVAGATFETLAALIDKSLVRLERSQRYNMHELLRQYAYVKLQESGESEKFHALHLNFFLHVAEEAKPLLETADQAQYLNRLEQEHANLRQAFYWALQSGTIEPGLRLATALWLFWFMRGYLTEGRETFAELFRSDQSGASSPVLAEARDKAGVLARYQGDFTQAASLIGEGLAIYRQLGDKAGIANSLANLGYIALHQLHNEEARALYSESLGLNRELENEQGTADSLLHLALIDRYEGHFAAALSRTEESLSIWRALGDRQAISWALHHLGNINLALNNPTIAYPLFIESLTISRELEFQWGFAWALEDFARVAAAYQDFEQALSLIGAALSLRNSIGIPLPPFEQAELNHILAAARETLDSERADAAWQQGLAMTPDRALAEIRNYGNVR